MLKPQDLLVALKVAVNDERTFLLSELATELFTAISLVHGSVRRAEQSRLLTRTGGNLQAVRQNLREFVIHGARYSFPGELGTLTRGMATGVGGPGLADLFSQADELVPVWPDPEGTAWGPSLEPLHASVPKAAKLDPALYRVLSLLEALRVGAARERAISVRQLSELL